MRVLKSKIRVAKSMEMKMKLNGIGSRSFSTAFDPSWFLHSENVTKLQSESFRKAWELNRGDFKSRLTAQEIDAFDREIKKTGSFEEFETKMKGLFGPERHLHIRSTRTWKYSQGKVEEFLASGKSNANAATLIFGDDKSFNTSFRDTYLLPPAHEAPNSSVINSDGVKKHPVVEQARKAVDAMTAQTTYSGKSGPELLAMYTYADLRYMVALQALDWYGAPEVTAVFGCRHTYHYKIPDPLSASAQWQNALFDRVPRYHLVLLSCLNAIRDGDEISTDYFRRILDSNEHNAFKDPEWHDFAKACAVMPQDKFIDQVDRAFTRFQTDKGVTKLETRFHKTDLIVGCSYDEGALYGTPTATLWGIK